MTLRPRRTLSFDPSRDLPPVASQMNWRRAAAQMLAEQTLCQRPIVMDLMQCFKSAVHLHCRRNGAVLDAVAGPGIARDYLPSWLSFCPRCRSVRLQMRALNCANNLSKRGIWELPSGIGAILISSNVLKDNYIDPYGYHIKVS